MQGIAVVFVCALALANCQELDEVPKDMAVLSGTDARFNCSVDGDIGTKILSWKEHITEPTGKLVFSSDMAGPNDPEDYAIEDNSDLIVKKADIEDGGWHSCKLTGGEVQMAYLIVVEPPVLIQNSIEFVENNVYNVGCNVQVGMPVVVDIHDEDRPVLEVNIGNRIVRGKKLDRVDGEVGVSASSYSMSFNFTALPEHDKTMLNCTVKLDKVNFSVNISHKLEVQHVTSSASISNPMNKYRVGQSITCMANGNPEPSYTWVPIDVPEGPEQMQEVKGNKLTVTKGMVGENEWRCEAWNGHERKDEVTAAIKFDAVMDPYGGGAEGVRMSLTSLCLAVVAALYYMA